MPMSFISDDVACEECGAIMQLRHNETIEPNFCPFCKAEMLLPMDVDEDPPWADLSDDDELDEDG
jgi:hypothetical protein